MPAAPAFLPLLSSKLTPPARRGAAPVPRDRLLRLLDDGAERGLVLVVAPPGFGKSTLLSQWCRRADRRVAWLSLEPADDDPVRFLRCVVAALERTLPGVGAPVLAAIDCVARGGAAAEAEHAVAFAALLELLAGLDAPLTLVLDDCHVLTHPTIRAALEALAERLPPSLCLVLSGRSDPPLPLARLRARGGLAEVRVDQLRFTEGEAGAFYADVLRLDLSPEEVARLGERTEGWAAGLQLAGLSLQGAPDRAAFLHSFAGTHRFVLDYLCDEVLERLPPERYRFLLHTSVLDRLCGPLCDAVTGGSGGQAALEELEGANLFLVPLDDERRWWRYHHLFADVLRARLLHDEGPGAAAPLHARAADWYAGAGMTEEAIRHALAGGDPARAAELLEGYGEAFWGRGEVGTLRRWLDALPEGLAPTRPRLAALRAMVLLHEGARAAELESLLRAVEREGVAPDLRGRAAVMRCFVVRGRGDLEGGEALARAALDLLGPESRLWRGMAVANLASVRWWRGESPEAEAMYAEAAGISRSGGDHFQELVLRSLAAAMCREQGRLRDAERGYREALDRAAELGIERSPATVYAHAGYGRLCYERNDLPGAVRHLSAALERDRGGFTNKVRLEVSLHLANVLRATGDDDGADRLLAEAEDALRRAGPADPVLYSAGALLAGIELSHGRTTRAAAWERGHRESVAGGLLELCRLPAVDREGVELLRARLALALGDAPSAAEILEPLLGPPREQGRHARVLEVRTLRAAVCEARGRHDEALRELGAVLALAEEERAVRAILDVGGESLMPTLKRAVAKGVHAAFAAELLELCAAAGGGEGVSPEPGRLGEGPDALTEREVEVLRLVAAGLSNRDIADQLFLAVGTVKRHVFNIYAKLNVAGRVEAASRAREAGLL